MNYACSNAGIILVATRYQDKPTLIILAIEPLNLQCSPTSPPILLNLLKIHAINEDHCSFLSSSQ